MPGEDTHALRAQLAVAIRERGDYHARAVNAEKRIEDVQAQREKQDAELAILRLNITQFERVCEAWNAQVVALRTALTDIVTLCMDVPATEDWRAKVGDKARKALYGEPGWKET